MNIVSEDCKGALLSIFVVQLKVSEKVTKCSSLTSKYRHANEQNEGWILPYIRRVKLVSVRSSIRRFYQKPIWFPKWTNYFVSLFLAISKSSSSFMYFSCTAATVKLECQGQQCKPASRKSNLVQYKINQISSTIDIPKNFFSFMSSPEMRTSKNRANNWQAKIGKYK